MKLLFNNISTDKFHASNLIEILSSLEFFPKTPRMRRILFGNIVLNCSLTPGNFISIIGIYLLQEIPTILLDLLKITKN